MSAGQEVCDYVLWGRLPAARACHCEARRAAALRAEGDEAISTPRKVLSRIPRIAYFVLILEDSNNE